MGIPSRWSYSSLSGWSDQCQRKWVATRINNVDDPTSKEAARGLVCHMVLERFCGLPKSLRKPEVYKQFEEEELAEAKLKWPELYNNGFVNAVRRRLQTAWNLERLQELPASIVEAKLEGVTPAGYQVVGYADRVDKVGEHVYLSDYKSGKASPYALPSVVKQLSVYAWLWSEMHGTPPELIHGRAIYLGSGNIKLVSITQQDIDNIKTWADESIADCLAQVNEDTEWFDVPATPSPLCGWCPLKEVCDSSTVRQ